MVNLPNFKMDLHALIKDNVRALYPHCANPIVTLTTQDRLWSVVIFHESSSSSRTRSGIGFKAREAAMENMLSFWEGLVWQILKEKGVELSK